MNEKNEITPVESFPVYEGGLDRCCIATLENHAKEDASEGQVMKCDYEPDDPPRLILDTKNRDVQLAWRWIGATQDYIPPGVGETA